MFQQARRALGAVAVLAAAGLGGAALADAASPQGTTGPTGPSSSASHAFNGPAPGTAGHEDAEKAVTGTAAAKAQAAAVKTVGGGTAGAVTTDYQGTGYEVSVTRSDGSKTEVHLTSTFQALRGPGGHGCPPGGSGTPPAGAPGA